MESMDIIIGKRILVSGGAGFIGSHLVKELVKRKAKVIVIDIAIKPQSFFAKEQLKKRVIYKNLDITNKNKVFEVFKTYTPDYIFHLAAEPIVAASYENPHATFMTNVMGTVNILEACRANKNTKVVIVASSDKAYGKTKKAYTEESPLQGDHPYDVSKSCTDLIAQSYAKTYNMPIVISRFGNVYGEGDIHKDRIIPGICASIIKKKKLLIRSDGTYVRDYVYVNDVVDGYIFLLNNREKVRGNAYNFSSQDSLTVLELIKKVESIVQHKIPYKILNSAKNEIPYQHLNDKKIRKLGWKNNYTLEKTMKNVLDWYYL